MEPELNSMVPEDERISYDMHGVVQRVAAEDDFENVILFHAIGANPAGQIASAVAGGVLLALMGAA